MQIISVKDPVCVKRAVETLKNGGLIIYPTETVYGAGVDATHPKAVQKLIAYKNRPFGKPFSIAVTDKTMAQKFVTVNSDAQKLYQRFLPGPLTVISQGLHQVAPGVESELGTLGIRIPNYPLVSQIVKGLGKPITATSANASYQKRPYQISDILNHLSDKQKKLIDLILDAGALPANEPSTVIDTTPGELSVLRAGQIRLSPTNILLSRNEENTLNIGKELWHKYERFWGQRAIVFALTGEMGAGKTVLTKGIAKAMGITETVTSPTYDLINNYQLTNKQINTNYQLTHIDAWRLQEGDELKNLDFDNFITDKSVVVIEWADKVADLIRHYHEEAIVVWVKIEYLKKLNERHILWTNQ